MKWQTKKKLRTDVLSLGTELEAAREELRALAALSDSWQQLAADRLAQLKDAERAVATAEQAVRMADTRANLADSTLQRYLNGGFEHQQHETPCPRCGRSMFTPPRSAGGFVGGISPAARCPYCGYNEAVHGKHNQVETVRSIRAAEIAEESRDHLGEFFDNMTGMSPDEIDAELIKRNPSLADANKDIHTDEEAAARVSERTFTYGEGQAEMAAMQREIDQEDEDEA